MVSKPLRAFAKPLDIQKCANWRMIDKKEMIIFTNPDLIKHGSFLSSRLQRPLAIKKTILRIAVFKYC